MDSPTSNEQSPNMTIGPPTQPQPQATKRTNRKSKAAQAAAAAAVAAAAQMQEQNAMVRTHFLIAIFYIKNAFLFVTLYHVCIIFVPYKIIIFAQPQMQPQPQPPDPQQSLVNDASILNDVIGTVMGGAGNVSLTPNTLFQSQNDNFSIKIILYTRECLYLYENFQHFWSAFRARGAHSQVKVSLLQKLVYFFF